MNNLTRLLLQSGPARIFAAIGVTALIATLLFGVMFRMGGEDKALLFSDVDMKEAGEITAKLDQANIKYELRGDGSAIYVPRSKVLSARMMLSADGLPSRGSVGYEIFDKPDALGATQFMQNMNRLRALEGELARSIASLDGVKAARVHLVLPERQLFEREQQKPSASIVLTLSNDALGPGEVRAIRNLVASATPGLSPGRVTILDETGRLLATAQAEGDISSDGADARETAVEDRIRRTVQDIVEGVVGPGAARVQVRAELDLSRVTQNSETFDPEGRVVRSTQTVEDSSNSEERQRREGATAANNLPDAASEGADGPGTKDNATRTEETVNYEISKTVKTEIIEGGTLKKLSVAVAVDDAVTPGANDAPPTYAPRSAEEMTRLTALVRSAVGYDEARGDRVEVINVRFARAPDGGTTAQKPGLMDFQKPDIMRISEIGAALLAALALIIFVLRPLVSGLMRGPQGASAGGEGQALLAAPAGAAPASAGGVPTAAGLPPPAAGLTAALPDPEPTIDVARIRGQVKASSVKKVAEVVEENPDESVSIIRGWLNEAV